MTVIRPNSVAGINSITVQSGNSLAVHKANGELIRTITSNTGVSTFSSVSVGTATTDNSAGKSINIGLGASISQHDDNTLTFGTSGDPVAKFDASGHFLPNADSQFNIGSNSVRFANGYFDTLYGDGSNLSGISANSISQGNSTAEILDTGTNGIFRFIPESSEVFRITHEAKVGINTNNPSHNLDISADGVAFPSAAGSTILRLRNSAGSATLSIDANAGNVSAIQFGDKDGASRGTVLYNHSTDTLNFNTDGSERARIGSSGGIGINTDKIRGASTINIAGVTRDYTTSSTDLVDAGGLIFQPTIHLLSTGQCYPGIFWSGNTASLGRARAGIMGVAMSNNDATDIVFLSKLNAGGASLTPADERMRIRNNGRIGIGTDQTTTTLQIYGVNDGEGTATGQLTLKDTAAYNASPTAGVVFQGHHASNNAQAIFSGIRGFKANASDGDYDGCLGFDVRKHGAVAYEAMRINEDGKLLVGTTATRTLALTAAAPQLQLEGVGSNASTSAIICNSNGTAAGVLDFGKTRGTAVGGTTIVQDGDDLGHIAFEGSDGSAQRVAARINARVDGSPGSSDMPGLLRFLTTPAGSATEEERMRISSTGQVRIGAAAGDFTSPFTTSTIFNVQRTNGNVASFYHHGTNNNPVIIVRHQRSGSSGNSGVNFQFNNTNGSAVGYILSNNSSTSFQTSSDYRLKENAVAISDGITRLKTLKPYRFNFKDDSTTTIDGFFAHEVTAVPEAVSGTKDEVVTQAKIDSGDAPSESKLNDPIYQGIDQSKLVPLLTAALQEAVTKIETLETKVAALEGG